MANYSIDPAFNPAIVAAYDAHKEAYADNDPVGTASDFGAPNGDTAATNNLDLTAAGGARPTFKTNVQGVKCFRFNGSSNFLKAATAADWKFFHDRHSWTVMALVRQSVFNSDHADPIFDTCNFSTANVGALGVIDSRSGGPYMQALWAQINNGTNFSDAPVGWAVVVDNVINSMIWNLVVFRFAAKAKINENFREALDDLRISVNGIVVTSEPWNTAKAFSSSNPNNALIVGSIGAGATLFASYDLGGLWIMDRDVGDEMLAAHARFLSDRVGGLPYVRMQDDSHNFTCGPVGEKLNDGTLISVLGSSIDDPTATGIYGIITRSGDKGWTWSLNHQLMIDSSHNRLAGSNGSLYTSAGTLLLAGWPTTSHVLKIYRSTDNGYSFGAALAPNSGLTGENTSGKGCQLSNGHILWPFFGKINGGDTFLSVRTVKSTDDGATWGSPVTIMNGQSLSKSYSEGSVIKLSGTYPTESLIAIMRNDTDVRIDKFFSTDSGATWGSGASIVTGRTGRPVGVKTQAGNLFMMVRVSNGRHVIRWSSNDGTSWSANDYWVDGLPVTAVYGWIIEIEPGLLFTFHDSFGSSFTTDPSHSMQRVSIHREQDILLIT